MAAVQAGLWKERLESAMPRIAELPFDSDRKRMTTVHKIEAVELLPNALRKLISSQAFSSDAAILAITKGSVDGLLDISNRVWTEQHVVEMDEAWRKRIMNANNELALKGMRVLGVAFRQCSNRRVNRLDIHWNRTWCLWECSR